MDWKQELLKRFDAVAAKLGTTAEYLWAVLVKQSIAQGIADAIIALLCLIAVLVLYKSVLPYCSKRFAEEDEKGCGTEIGWEFAIGFTIAGIVVLSVAFGVNLHDAVLELVNPQYYALHEVLQTLGR